MFLFKIILKSLIAMSVSLIVLLVAGYLFLLTAIAGFWLDAFAILICAVLIWVVIFTTLFMKGNILLRIFLFIAVLFVVPQIPFRFLPNVDKVLNIDMCIDTGVCVEGIPWGVGDDRIIINKETCENNNWKWYDDRNVCNMRE